MPKEETKSDRKTSLVIWRNVIAAVVILALIVARQAIIQSSVNDGLDMSHFINVAGRQSMLSQKISKSAYRLAFDESGFDSGTKDELKEDLEEWESAYLYLSSEHTDDGHTFHFSTDVTHGLNDIYKYQGSVLKFRTV